MNIQEKANYVRSQPQTREHQCHWPGCTRQVPPAMWGCIIHWRLLPFYLRRKIFEAFEPGQEITITPSDKYIAVMVEVNDWIRANRLHTGK